VRKWTKSACVALAWCILPVLVTAGMSGSARSAQANHRIASNITQVTLVSSVSMTAPRGTAPAAAARYVVQPGDTLSGIAGALTVPGGWQALYAANRPRIGADPNVIHPGTVLVLPGPRVPLRYTVAAGDTLSGIAAGLAVPGGWRALYAANRRVIGPDPNLVLPGTILVAPPPAASAPARVPPAPRSGSNHQQPAPAQPQVPAPAIATPTPKAPPPIAAPPPANEQSPAGPAASGSAQSPRAGHQATPVAARPASARLPGWLTMLLLAAGALIAIAFLTEAAMVLGRRRRRARRAREAAEKARIVLADHERLIVTYSTVDDTVYVLTPPGEDPRSVLRAARLVVPDDTYEVLAGHLGVPANWPLE
jgi:nucleoid-associated protein YgaU